MFYSCFNRYKVCICADENDDNRHTRVLRAIAAMVTAPHCAVHENTLLFCVTTCFQIALMGKSSSTRTAAEKTILSIYDLTAKRLEEKHAAAVIDGVAEVLMPMEGMSMSTSMSMSMSMSMTSIQKNMQFTIAKRLRLSQYPW